MKTKEESLSNYRIEANQNDSSQAKYPEDKVKEAVKKLKEEIKGKEIEASYHILSSFLISKYLSTTKDKDFDELNEGYRFAIDDCLIEIDKIFGEKLTNNIFPRPKGRGIYP